MRRKLMEGRSLRSRLQVLCVGLALYEASCSTRLLPPPTDVPQIASMGRWISEAQPERTLPPSPTSGTTTYLLDNSRPITLGSNRIVGGEKFTGIDAIGAVLLRDDSGVTRPHCTGTLIRETVVLTAAHCLHRFDTRMMSFAIGPNAWSPSIVYSVSKGIVHEGYQTSSYGVNDIALLYLDYPAVGITYVRLPESTNQVEDWIRSEGQLTFVGYGYAVNSDGIKYNIGQKARVDIPIPVTAFQKSTFRYSSPGKNTCNGDSGGPALKLSASGTPVVVGITSWGDSACSKFGVDMRVDAYLHWISSHTPASSAGEGTRRLTNSDEPYEHSEAFRSCDRSKTYVGFRGLEESAIPSLTLPNARKEDNGSATISSEEVIEGYIPTSCDRSYWLAFKDTRYDARASVRSEPVIPNRDGRFSTRITTPPTSAASFLCLVSADAPGDFRLWRQISNQVQAKPVSIVLDNSHYTELECREVRFPTSTTF